MAQKTNYYKLVYVIQAFVQAKMLLECLGKGPGGGGTPLYGLYRYVRPQRVWFFSRFGHK